MMLKNSIFSISTNMNVLKELNNACDPEKTLKIIKTNKILDVLIKVTIDLNIQVWNKHLTPYPLNPPE